MSSLCRSRSRRAIAAALLLGAVRMHRAGAAEPVKVCVDDANPTMAMDMRVAASAARTQGRAVEFVRFVGYGKGGDGFPVGRFAQMAASRCALIMGFPVDASDPHLPPGVAATGAYASTGFVLVRRRDAPPESLAQMAAGSEVGIAQLDTYAGLLYALHPNIVMHVYPGDAQMLADLEAGRIAAGLAWQPEIEAYAAAHAHEQALRVQMLPGRHMLWNLVGLYLPARRDSIGWFERGVGALERSGRLAGLIEPYRAAVGAPRISRLADAPPRWLDVADTDATPAATPAPLPPPPALYTEAQAKQGALAYYQNCAMCHGPLLDGQEGGYSGPALKGADFADPSYDFHVSDIFNFVAKLMPAATPGSLAPQQDVAIMAFILQQNGYPAGDRELTYGAAAKSAVPLRYYGR